MSELTLFIFRLAFLALLWIFVLSALSVIRSDIFGTRKTSRSGAVVETAPARREPPANVVVVEGPSQGVSVPLGAAPVVVGRSEAASIQLDDDYVSTRHARFLASGDQWYVEDLGSTNGTYVGSVRVTSPTPITLGTQVRIGKSILEIER